MNYDFGMDCPLRWERKVEEALDELNEINDKLYCADEDEIEELEQDQEAAEAALRSAEYVFDSIINDLDRKWWPALVRDAIAATAEDNAELAAI